MSTNACPCGSGRPFDHCCKPLLGGAVTAVTAEDLMRSRYTAFVVNDAAYLAHTWHSTTRPTEVTAPSGIEWRRLRIRDTRLGGAEDIPVRWSSSPITGPLTAPVIFCMNAPGLLAKRGAGCMWTESFSSQSALQ